MIEIPAAALALPMFMQRAGFPVDRHQRPDPVHARHRPHRRRGGAPVRPAAPGGAAPGRAHHPDRQRAATCRWRCAARWRATSRSRACCSASACAISRCTRRSCSAIKERVLRTNLAEVQPLAQKRAALSRPGEDARAAGETEFLRRNHEECPAPVLALLSACSAIAQTYPPSPVKLVVPFPAGSATDQVARVIGQQLQEALRQPFVVENKPGAQGAIAAAEVARRRARRLHADGHHQHAAGGQRRACSRSCTTTR